MRSLVNKFGKTDASSTCKSACPVECNSVDYSFTSVNAFYPTNLYSDYLYDFSIYRGININRSSISQAFAKVNIYYHSMQYTTTTQVAQYQVSDLFSSFGGTLGLFLGMSFLTFAELIDLGFNLGMVLLKYFQVKKQKAKVGQNEIITKQFYSFHSNVVTIKQPSDTFYTEVNE